MPLLAHLDITVCGHEARTQTGDSCYRPGQLQCGKQSRNHEESCTPICGTPVGPSIGCTTLIITACMVQAMSAPTRRQCYSVGSTAGPTASKQALQLLDAHCNDPADLEPAWDLWHRLCLLNTRWTRNTDALVESVCTPLWPESSSRARSLAACALSAASRWMRLRLSVEVRLASRDALRRLLWKE